MFNKKLKSKISDISQINEDLVKKTHELTAENAEINNVLTRISGYQVFTGENTINELGIPNEIIIDYETLRVRSWEFLLKNHLAGLIVQKRVNWQIGAGLLFNAKPNIKPFFDFYNDEELANQKQHQFIKDIEYSFRNFSNTELVDYSKAKNLHEIARHVDYNASGDGDMLLVMRVKNGFPNIETISGQCVIAPLITSDEVKKGNSVCEGVEFNDKGVIVAYHVLTNTNISNGVYTPEPKDLDYGTKRIPVYFKGTDIKQAWLYRQSDLQKQGETRSMPLLSHVFETLKHVNDYLIANSKNAQLLAQMVFFLEKDQNSNGERVFGDDNLNVAGMGETPTTETCATDPEVLAAANKLQYNLNGNGIVADLPKGVKGKILNPQAQSDQAEYLKSTLQSLFASINQPYEVTLSSYDSNYSASMGARSDFQAALDVLTEIIPSNQLYKKAYEMFVYLQVLSGNIICEPLKKAYNENDAITIQSIINSKFEGTKLKPIDPLKFIKSLREQMPAKYRDLIPLNTNENLINAASNGDYESVITQFMNEVSLLPKELTPEIPKDETKAV